MPQPINSDAFNQQLTLLWQARDAEGFDKYTATQIGFLMHRTKGQIIGYGHRLSLGVRNPRRSPPTAPTPGTFVRRRREAKPAAPAKRTHHAKPKPPKPVVSPIAPEPKPPGGAPCRWPIGDPKRKDFRFCEAPALFGKSYCAEHAQIAYGGTYWRGAHITAP
jgi:hypothetical protein